jgi:hypothetical protein
MDRRRKRLTAFSMLLAKSLQLCDPSVNFYFSIVELTDILHCLVVLHVQGTGQLHLVRQTSHVVTISSRQHHSINSFVGTAREVSVLRMLHLIVLLMM